MGTWLHRHKRRSATKASMSSMASIASFSPTATMRATSGTTRKELNWKTMWTLSLTGRERIFQTLSMKSSPIPRKFGQGRRTLLPLVSDHNTARRADCSAGQHNRQIHRKISRDTLSWCGQRAGVPKGWLLFAGISSCHFRGHGDKA